MIKENRILSFKYSVLQYTRKHKNIAFTCRVFNISRTIYYRRLKRFIKLGYLGLLDKKKRKPKMPNKIKPDKEKIILNYIIECPTHGPRRIANELRQQKIKISEAGAYNLLKRRRLNHQLDSLFYAQKRSGNPVITKGNSSIWVGREIMVTSKK